VCGGIGGTTTDLQNSTPVTGLSGSASQELAYKITVPAGATNLVFALSGGTGDADMYTRFGSAPTTGSYDCRPYVSGNNEQRTLGYVLHQAARLHGFLRRVAEGHLAIP
jgi:hypothetical protein